MVWKKQYKLSMTHTSPHLRMLEKLMKEIKLLRRDIQVIQRDIEALTRGAKKDPPP